MNVIGLASSSFSEPPPGIDIVPSITRASNLVRAKVSNCSGFAIQASRFANRSINSKPMLWRGGAALRSGGGVAVVIFFKKVGGAEVGGRERIISYFLLSH